MTDPTRLVRCSKIISMVPANSLSQEPMSKNIMYDELSSPSSSKENNFFNNEDLSNISNLDFDSDDSIFDKDYIPTSFEHENSSVDSDCSMDVIPNSQPINVTIPESPEILNDEMESENLTKKGEPRKRKKYEDTPAQRREKKKLLDMETKYQLKPGCNVNKCIKKCHTHFNEEERRNINNYFRKMTWIQQQYFITNNTSKEQPKRKTVTENRKLPRDVSVSYFLTNKTGLKINVCKVFFLETLGYNKKNDKSVRTALDTKPNINPVEKRGKNPNLKKIDDTMIIQHINSFNPLVSHYRREHAPNRKYLPSDLTVAKMYQDFCEKDNERPIREQISYEVYRKVVKKLNISFTKLGNEQCEECEVYFIHNPEYMEKRHRNCEKCMEYETHREKYTTARQAYKSDVEKQNANINSDTGYYAADLEKVIMLPRIEGFKKVLFCPRIIVFNESFVPIGDKKNNPAYKTYAAIWHEAIAGRKVNDIASCFRSFLISVRDLKHLVIWLDNCASQNKNWTLYSYLIYAVNSTEVNFQSITLKYLEVGHTHMSADEFHHQVEVAMKKKKHLYDYEDFHQAVLSTRKNITVKSMNVDDFFQFEDCSSIYKLQNSSPRAYLSNMCEVTFSRGTHIIRYKTAFDDQNEYSLDFLKQKNIKSGITPPQKVKECRGINQDRKSVIIQKLTPLMPNNRRPFWYNLPTNTNSADLTQVYED